MWLSLVGVNKTNWFFFGRFAKNLKGKTCCLLLVHQKTKLNLYWDFPRDF